MRLTAAALGIIVLVVGDLAVALATGDGRSAAHTTVVDKSLAAQQGPAADVVPAHPGPHAVNPATLHKKGGFDGVDGRVYTVFGGATNDGENRCAVTTGGGFSDVVCDPAPFADSPLEFGESSSAGPGGSPIHEWRVSGIARADVARITVRDSRERIRPVELSSDGAFFFELPRSDIARGITAVSLLVYGSDGELIKEVVL